MKQNNPILHYFTTYCYSFKNNRAELAKSIASLLKDGAEVMDIDIFSLLKHKMYEEALMCIAYKKTPINYTKLLGSCIDHDVSLDAFRFIADMCPVTPEFPKQYYDEEILAKFQDPISYYKMRDACLAQAFQQKGHSVDHTSFPLRIKDQEMISTNLSSINTE
jgi:hypothetical protein